MTHALMLVPRLHLLYQQLSQCQAQIAKMLDELPAEEIPGQSSEHRDVLVLRSLPGSGRYGIATMLAEAHAGLRSRDYVSLRATCGSAPVTKQSGRMRVVQMRYACNPRLRYAMHHWAWNAARNDPYYARLYKAMRGRGLTHGRALRGIADRLLELAVVLLERGTLYDPAVRKVAA